jgi:hypothetical protein
VVTVDQSVVTEAVRTLRARGERVSVRAVHTLIGGGSFRDISRFLRDAREFLADDEIAALDTEVTEPVVQPTLGKIVAAYRSAQAEDQAAGEAGAILHTMREQLRDLVAHRPPQGSSLRRSRPRSMHALSMISRCNACRNR